MEGTALITVLFDYPTDWEPKFYKNSLKYFEESNVHILRYNNILKSDSYYEKLYFHKIIKLNEYLKTNILKKYQYVLFLDATDTNFCSDPNRLINDFKENDKSIIFCSERGLWPPTKYTHLYNERPKLSESCYLNSGVYFGLVDKIIQHLDKIIEEEYSIDDQGAWSAEYLLSTDIEVDQENKYFFSTFRSKELINIENNSVEFIGITPIIIHDNGPVNIEDTIKLTDKLNGIWD